tara:strand:- start:55 stop:582 length:528 start_codon:yes stop_codon:yes gene_type:complete
MYNDKIKYAGIGSRQATDEVLENILEIGQEFADRGYILRSGGASGCDSFFEIGCNLGGGEKEIFLPWKNFNNNKSFRFEVGEDALAMGEKFHPRWDKLSEKAKLLISRNSYQILGEELDDPVNFVVCWTPDGEESGGTGQGLRIAEYYKIPVFNLGKGLTPKELYDMLEQLIMFV